MVQREKLERTEKQLDDINSTLRFSQKHINGIKVSIFLVVFIFVFYYFDRFFLNLCLFSSVLCRVCLVA